MTLAPKLPPGRANRKALQFAADIQRLRSVGYTFSAIRMALLDAGVSVSLSTIKREAARRGTAPLYASHTGVAPHSTPNPVPMATSPDIPTLRRLGPPGASGREIAEAFFKAHPSNPLLQARETS
jgi:hypothetical protein